MSVRSGIILLVFGACAALFVDAQSPTVAQSVNQSPTSTLAEFTSQIMHVDHDGRNYKNDFNLYRLSSLKQLSRESNLNIGACLEFLAIPVKTRRQRYIALTAMSGLALEERIAFLKQLTHFADAGKISRYEFSDAVFPPFGQSVQFVLQYRDPRVVHFLTDLLSNPVSDASLKQNIERTLSGEAIGDLLDYWKLELTTSGDWPNWGDVPTALWLAASGYYLTPVVIVLVFIGFALLVVMAFRRVPCENGSR